MTTFRLLEHKKADVIAYLMTLQRQGSSWPRLDSRIDEKTPAQFGAGRALQRITVRTHYAVRTFILSFSVIFHCVPNYPHDMYELTSIKGCPHGRGRAEF